MSSIVLQHDVAALGALRRLSDQAAATAGGSGDNTLVTGYTLDRMGFGNGSMPQSAEFATLFTAALGAGNTLTIALDVQHSPDGSAWTDFATQAATVVATGPTGGGTETGQLTFGVDLGAADRYVRLNFTPNLSAANTDTCDVIGCGFFAGFDSLPAPQ